MAISLIRTASFRWPVVDPETSLAPRGEAVVEVKVLIHRGSLDDALQRAIRQRSLLK
jgi:hypothetical protein